jgi:diguanylate cyclase (GGDEF)-like protein/PAS domain S-box-containing protein
LSNPLIQSALFARLLATSKFALITSTIIAITFTYAQRQVIAVPIVLTWLCLVILIAIIRALHVQSCLRMSLDNHSILYAQLLKFRYITIIAGLVWGSAGFLLFPPNNPEHQMFLIFLLAGVSAGVVTSYSADIISAIAFVSALLIPLMIRLFMHNSSISIAMGFAAVIYFAFVVVNIRRANQSLTENIILKLEASENQRIVSSSANRYNTLFSHSPVAIFHFDTDLVITHCNARYAAILGLPTDGLIGLELMNFIQDQSILPALKSALNGEVGYYDGYYSANYSNAKKWINLICLPSIDGYKKVDGGVAILHDTTDHKQAQENLLSSDEWHRAILAGAMDGYWLTDLQGQLLEVNKAYCEMSGYSQQELLTMFNSDLEAIRSHEEVIEHIQNISNLGEDRFESQHRRKDGSIFYVEISVQYRQTEGGRLVVFLQDITERKLKENDLRVAATAFNARDGIIISDFNNLIIRTNQAFTKTSGYTQEEVLGKNLIMFCAKQNETHLYTTILTSIMRHGFWEGEIWNQRKNGESYPAHLNITVVKDKNNNVENFVTHLTDISSQKAAAAEIENLAFYDTVTGLPNRRLLMDRLNHALASSTRNGKEGALLFLDLDNFKTLNDSSGHDVGDMLLKMVAKRLKECVREVDTIARFGGDEFVVVLEDLKTQNLGAQKNDAKTQAETVANKILAALHQPYLINEHKHHSGVSIGITLFNSNPPSTEELLKQADIAMYEAKKTRNTVRFFNPEMQASITAHVSLEHELRKAIELQQFQLYYQTQVDSAGCATGAEVLVRWLHPEQGLIAPAEFIPLAEDTALILPIGQWVLEGACAQIKAWQNNALTRNFTLSVNVSAKQFHQEHFVDQVKTALLYHDISPALLKLELTESMLLKDVESTIETMQALREIGVQFSLDDFGTGYSSLQYLKRLPLNQLKIDESFVRDIVVNTSDQAIVHTISAMANTLELNVIAEGVETREQYMQLQKIGCRHYQGYLFGKPVPINEFDKNLAHSAHLDFFIPEDSSTSLETTSKNSLY